MTTPAIPAKGVHDAGAPDAPGAALRTAAPGDVDLLTALGARLFRATYEQQTSRADLDAYIAEVYRADRVAGTLADPCQRYTIAEVGGTPIGYALVEHGARPPYGRAERPLALAELYVDHAFHGRGIGPLLLRATLDDASASSADLVWLTVWERNARAIRFYRREGFRQLGETTFSLGRVQQRDLVLARAVDDQR